jgi:hypothetical protein
MFSHGPKKFWRRSNLLVCLNLFVYKFQPFLVLSFQLSSSLLCGVKSMQMALCKHLYLSLIGDIVTWDNSTATFRCCCLNLSQVYPGFEVIYPPSVIGYYIGAGITQPFFFFFWKIEVKKYWNQQNQSKTTIMHQCFMRKVQNSVSVCLYSIYTSWPRNQWWNKNTHVAGFLLLGYVPTVQIDLTDNFEYSGKLRRQVVTEDWNGQR